MFLISQVSRRNMLSTAAVNSLGYMVSPCRNPLLMLILLLSLCRWTIISVHLSKCIRNVIVSCFQCVGVYKVIISLIDFVVNAIYIFL